MSGALEEARGALDPLGCFDVDALLEGAARLRPERTAFADRLATLTFREADRRARALAAAYGDLGLAPGETILLAVGAPTVSFVALAAALRAGLKVAVAPAWSDSAAAARMALLSGAAALVIASGEENFASAEVWLTAAAAAPSVRVVCSLGAQKVDGALCLDPAALEDPDRPDQPGGATRPKILTFEPNARPVAHAQRALVAAALDVASRAHIGVRLPLVSTIAPASFAGLAAGPIASLIAGASLIWAIPFEAQAFLATLDKAAPAHLIVPAAMAPLLEQAGLVSPDALASLILVSRRHDWTSTAPEAPRFRAPAGDERMPVVDLYAYGERAIAPEPRGADGEPVPPVREPHHLDLDGTRILALDWSSDGAGPHLEGAAVSSG